MSHSVGQWRGITKGWDDFVGHSSMEVGDGGWTKFWNCV